MRRVEKRGSLRPINAVAPSTYPHLTTVLQLQLLSIVSKMVI